MCYEDFFFVNLALKFRICKNISQLFLSMLPIWFTKSIKCKYTNPCINLSIYYINLVDLRIFDPDMSPLGFQLDQMYQFASRRMEGNDPDQQQVNSHQLQRVPENMKLRDFRCFRESLLINWAYFKGFYQI